MKITIIGCGKMGSCIAEGAAQAHELTLCDRNEERTKQLAKKLNAVYSSSPSQAAANAEVIVIAVKPHDIDKIAKLIHRELSDDQLVVSVLAGVSTESLQAHFKDVSVVRMMPNVPVRYGAGVVGFEEYDGFPSEMKKKAKEAFASLGSLHWLPESKFDALTALTGSGPAFVFVIMESIIDAGITMGLPAAQAKELAIQLVRGSLTMMEESGEHPGELKWSVTSPAGTTIAGVKMMEDCGIRSGLINTFLASFHRSKELTSENE